MIPSVKQLSVLFWEDIDGYQTIDDHFSFNDFSFGDAEVTLVKPERVLREISQAKDTGDFPEDVRHVVENVILSLDWIMLRNNLRPSNDLIMIAFVG